MTGWPVGDSSAVNTVTDPPSEMSAPAKVVGITITSGWSALAVGGAISPSCSASDRSSESDRSSPANTVAIRATSRLLPPPIPTTTSASVSAMRSRTWNADSTCLAGVVPSYVAVSRSSRPARMGSIRSSLAPTFDPHTISASERSRSARYPPKSSTQPRP